MRLPKQCPDVSRTLSAEANTAGEVTPAFLGALGTIAKVAAPIIGSLF